MAAKTTIARDVWLKAVADAAAASVKHDPNILSLQELADVFGVKRGAAEKRVKMLVAAGKAQKTTKFILPPGSISPRRVPAYRLLK